MKMKCFYWILMVCVVLTIAAVLWFFVPWNGSSTVTTASSEAKDSAWKDALISAENNRIRGNFGDIKDYLDLLDDPTNNDYTISAVAECVGTNLYNNLDSEDDYNALLEQMDSPDLNNKYYTQIITEEENCGYEELLKQAEHMYLYSDCVNQGYCTTAELKDFFQCFIGDGSADNVDKCASDTGNSCPGNCELKDLVVRNLRARRRQELGALRR